MSVPSPASASRSLISTLLPIMAAVFTSFLVIGLALPVLPLHVHHDLGLGTFIVGLVSGSQFAASLLSRVWAGQYADRHGAKRTMLLGLAGAAASGLLYLASIPFSHLPPVSVAVLLLGRAVLGGAESFIITGALSWGLAAVDERSAGKVIAWIGTAMYAAFAVGAPIGSLLFEQLGFAAIAGATALIPVVAAGLVIRQAAVVLAARAQPSSLRQVIGAVWLPGMGVAFSSIGFGAMTAFIALLFADRGWTPVWLAFTVFAAAFIVARAVLGHLPDERGGARVALVFVLIEAAGLLCIWTADTPFPALVGSLIAGLGYSLVYPGLGVEAVRRVPPQSRGLAMGTYTAFLDLALGLMTPVLGLIAGWSHLGAVFLISALMALLCAGVCMSLLRSQRTAAA